VDWHKVSKTGECRKLLGQPYGGNASSMTIRSMFTLICCSLAGLKISLRTGFCCRNVLVQDKIKMYRKLYLSLPHIGIKKSPVQIALLHLQFWDGALLPSADCIFSPANFLDLLTRKFFTCRVGMAPSHLQSFFLADFSDAVLGWHRPGLPNSRKKIINGINHGGFCHYVHTSPIVFFSCIAGLVRDLVGQQLE